ncbi:MAG: CBS domain-containing protein [Deltaproteobacteria bacterium]
MMREDFIFEEEAIANERASEPAWPKESILQAPIADLPEVREPIAVGPDATLRQAIETMNREHVGCVLVVVDEKLVGIFTERDVLRQIATSRIDIDNATVESVMTRDPETLTREDAISYALNRMTIGGFRHVPLVDDEGYPVGIIAMRSICEYLVALFPREVLNLPPRPGLSISRTREGA